MALHIDKYQLIPPKIAEALQKAGMGDLKVGDILLMSDHNSSHATDVHCVIGFEDSKKYKTIYIKYRVATNWEATEWSEEEQTSIGDYKNYYYPGSIKIPSGRTVQDCWDEAKNILDGKTDVTTYKDDSTDNLNTNTALIHKNSKAGLEAIKNGLEEKRSRVELMHAFISYEMERRRRDLDKIRKEMYGVLTAFEKKIQRIMRVISSIELYLGIKEELFQIQEGPTAPIDTPISFRQQVLYMDEEIGHWEDGGLDFKNIKWFDEWLIKDNNFKKLAPEEKCVIVFRPRRGEKYYTKEWKENIRMNQPNFATYLLIRNGDNLYRIYTEKINIYPRLFPQRKELEKILKEIDEEEWESRKEEAKEKAEDLTYQYQQRAMLLQGLIDRTEVFNPLPGGRISIFNMDATPGAVNFIYDDEDTLPTGKLLFWDWWEKLNQGIKEGSRILMTGQYDTYKGWHSVKDFEDRFYMKENWNGNKRLPGKLPDQGIYTVESYSASWTAKMRKSSYENLLSGFPGGIRKHEVNGKMVPSDRYKLIDTKRNYYRMVIDGSNDMYLIKFTSLKEELSIKYQPGGEVTHGWGWNDVRDRKNKVRFRIYDDDKFVLNYDQLSLKDVEFYLNSRVDRPNYLGMMPILEKIKKFRLEELKNEKEFIRFIAERNKIKGLTTEEVRARVIKVVVWWKYKNKWKRPITKDDTLALRMIERTINSKNFNKLKIQT